MQCFSTVLSVQEHAAAGSALRREKLPPSKLALEKSPFGELADFVGSYGGLPSLHDSEAELEPGSRPYELSRVSPAAPSPA